MDTKIPTSNINIYHVINLFNQQFQKEPLSVRLDFVDDHHIYMQMTYDKNVKIQAHQGWLDHDMEADCNSVMMKIWLTRNEKTQKPEFILWKDEGIYINPYVMPDYHLAEQFWSAKSEMAKSKADFLLGCYHITISDRLLNQAIQKSISRMNYKQKELNEHKLWNIKRKDLMTYIENNETSIKEISSIIEEIRTIKDTLEILMEEKQNRKHKEESP